MEQAFMHFARDAAWAMLIILILAAIGLLSIIRWIVGLFRKTERAVESGVKNVEDAFHHE